MSSVSFSATVVSGFEVEFKTKQKEATKYDPDTGNPYQTLVDDKRVAIIDGVEIDVHENHIEKFSKLTLVHEGWGELGDQYFLGDEVADVTEYDPAVNFSNYSPSNDLQNFAAKYGLTIQFYVVLSWG